VAYRFQLAEFHIHLQTAHSRLTRLGELFGEDPDRFELELARRAA
jgi:hypothetical protein